MGELDKSLLDRKGSLWSIKETTQAGSWVWRNILKCREAAKKLHKVDIKNGRVTSFWYELWSPLGCLKDLLCDRGYIDMGISINATVSECRRYRRRFHRNPIFNRVEEEIDKYKANITKEDDVSLWKNNKWVYKNSFSLKETWQATRVQYQSCYWYKMVWFKHATPKFSFVMWLAMKDRLSKGERMSNWSGNIDTTCVFCQVPMETLAHLFFECPYSSQIWEALTRRVMESRYTTSWRGIMRVALDQTQGKIMLFTLRYVLQVDVHIIWIERNRKRHGETPKLAVLVIKWIDKVVKNKLSIIKKKGDKELIGGRVYWFSTR